MMCAIFPWVVDKQEQDLVLEKDYKRWVLLDTSSRAPDVRDFLAEGRMSQEGLQG